MLILSCCEIENCNANDELDFFVLRFFQKDDLTRKKVAFKVTSGDVDYGLNYAKDSTSIELPLDPNKEVVTFRFDSLDSDVSHELTLSYETQVSIFDPKCPPSFYFMNLDTIAYTFDSVSIPGKLTNVQLDTNVEVFIQ